MSDLAADISTVAPAKPSHRSAVSNGSTLLLNVDGRSARARRYRDLTDEFLKQAGDAGEAQQALSRRAASLSLMCEELESALARGEAVDLGKLSTATNSLRRVFADLGITNRRKRRA